MAEGGEEPTVLGTNLGLGHVGPYALIDLLGRGGMASVYLARHNKTGSQWTVAGGFGLEAENSGHGGIPAVPAGVMLVPTGLVWFIGSLVEGDPPELPWISLVAGAILGGAELAAMLAPENG